MFSVKVGVREVSSSIEVGPCEVCVVEVGTGKVVVVVAPIVVVVRLEVRSDGAGDGSSDVQVVAGVFVGLVGVVVFRVMRSGGAAA
jgi:hypothetical protein